MPFEQGVHTETFRIYYEDTDAGGIVYHANYLKYAERGRTDALRELGVHQSQLREDKGVFFVLRHCDITFIAPMLLDDLITVKSEVTHIGNTSLKMKQTIWRDDLEVAQMLMHIVCVSNAKKAVRIPSEIVTLLREKMMPEQPTKESA